MERSIAAGLSLGLATLAGCSAPAPGEAPGSARSAIVNGTVDEGDPAVVAVWVGEGVCTGTLVSPRVVVTAQHCTVGLSPSDVQVFFGTNAYGDGNWWQATHMDAHATGDIAAVTIESEGPATPFPLTDHVLAAGDEGLPVRIVGFGVTSEYGQDDGIKRQATTELVEWDNDFLYIDGYGEDTCYGDSGGPAFIDFGNGERLAGVTSFGTAKCGNELSGETRVDAFLDWVVAYIDAEDPASCGSDARCATGCPEIDPDCPCAGDGFCTSACSDAASDPDCETCTADGTCSAGCGDADPDCCVADGNCDGACGSSDPDCGDDVDDGDGSTSGDPDPDDGEDDDDDDRQKSSPDGGADSGCHAAPGRAISPDGQRAPWPWLVAALWCLSRRRRRASR